MPDDVTDWYGDVMKDLALACRRDGLHKTAEALDDAAILLEQEGDELASKREAGRGKGLKLVVGHD